MKKFSYPLLMSLLLLALSSPKFAHGQVTIAEDVNFEGAPSFSDSNDIYDPYEKWNRKVFVFNDKVYRYLFGPVAKGYNFIVPKFAQKRIHNVFTNIKMPKRFFNSLFQKKFKGSAIAFSRFLINSTVGIGGLFNPATHVFGLNLQDEDFGQTLGFYGMNEGPYIVIPFLGPSTKRDIVGKVGNEALNPLFWVTVLAVDLQDVFFVAHVGSGINHYAYKVYDSYIEFQENSIDPYASFRDIYIKYRRNKMKK